MTTRRIIMIIVGVILLIVVLGWLSSNWGKLTSGAKKANTDKVLTIEEECPPTNQITVGITGDSVLKLVAENAMLKEALKNCEGKKKPAKTTTTKRQVTERKQAPQSESTTRRETTTPKQLRSRSTDNNLATNQYIGMMVGDYGVTFNDQSNLVYYVKSSKIAEIPDRSTNEARLNSKDGPLGERQGEYVVFTSPIVVLTDMLDNNWNFAIYIGDHTQYGFDMWLPHELIKLTPSLESDSQISPNGVGGYHFTSTINYRML